MYTVLFNFGLLIVKVQQRIEMHVCQLSELYAAKRCFELDFFNSLHTSFCKSSSGWLWHFCPRGIIWTLFAEIL